MQVTYKNIRYGMLVKVMNDSGYHSGCKVHFYNKKGVLVGNLYQFLPYDRLRMREDELNHYPRYFYNRSTEPIRDALFRPVLFMVDRLIRITQKIMD